MSFVSVMAVALPVAALIIAVVAGVICMKKTGNGKKAFVRHFIVLGAALAVCLIFTGAVYAAESTGNDTTATAAAVSEVAADSETAAASANSGAGSATGLGFIGAAIAIGLAAVGAGIALAAGAPAAIGAVAEDPKSFGKSMIFVALGEAVAIYGFIIAFLMILKIPDLPTL